MAKRLFSLSFTAWSLVITPPGLDKCVDCRVQTFEGAVALSISCLSYATSLVDGVVLVAPCGMGIRWQKGITDKGPDPKEPETSNVST